MRNILIVQGGGRPNGNTAPLVQASVNGATGKGRRAEVISLAKTEVKGCLGCNACRYGKPCVMS